MNFDENVVQEDTVYNPKIETKHDVTPSNEPEDLNEKIDKLFYTTFEQEEPQPIVRCKLRKISKAAIPHHLTPQNIKKTKLLSPT